MHAVFQEAADSAVMNATVQKMLFFQIKILTLTCDFLTNLLNFTIKKRLVKLRNNGNKKYDGI